MRILFIGKYDEVQFFENESEFLEYCNDEEVDFNDNYMSPAPKAYAIPDDLPELKVEQVPSRYKIVADTTPLATAGTLPAPLEGETVGAYARRISGGDIG